MRAISLNDSLDNLNLRITPLGLPVLKHLFLKRIRLDDLGNLSNLATADCFSSKVELGLLIIPFNSSLREEYFLIFLANDFDQFVAEAPTARSNVREMELANYLLNHQGIQGGVVNASAEKHGHVVSEQKIYNTLGSSGFMSSNWGRF